MTTHAKGVPAGRWLHILPPCILVYIVAFIDRTNIGFATAGGMDKELNMSATMSGLVSGIFFAGYLFLQIPGGRIAERRSAKKFIAYTILAWGGLTVVSGFAQNIAQVLIIRFLVGVAEGGVWPAILIIISHWFPRSERGRANAFFMMNAPIASIITGPLSGWILQSYTWRHLFIIEGVLALLLMLIWLPLISDSPKDAKWISEAEREYINSSLKEEQAALNAQGAGKIAVGEVLSDGKVWKLIGIYFCYQTGIYGFVLWLPSLLKTLTNAGMMAVGLLSVIPYIAAAIGLFVFGRLSDRSMNRKLYTVIPMLGFAICLLLSVQFKTDIRVSFGFLVLCGFFLLSANGVFWTIPTLLFPADKAATSFGIINIAGGLGGFLGPYLIGFLTNEFNADTGIYAVVLILLTGFSLALTLPAKTGTLNRSAWNRVPADLRR